MTAPAETPPADCSLCPRLVAYREANRAAHPDWHNAPVAAFGPLEAGVLIVGLAPGVSGANRTGRPFTGDWAGDLLYPTLVGAGLASGRYDRRPDDSLRLSGCRITNAVRCVPPQNKPVGAECRACRPFLAAEIAAMPALRAIVALGRLAHDNILSALQLRRADFVFAHGAEHDLGDGRTLFDSYHCSRYNTNTGRLTPAMFQAVFARVANAV